MLTTDCRDALLRRDVLTSDCRDALMLTTDCRNALMLTSGCRDALMLTSDCRDALMLTTDCLTVCCIMHSMFCIRRYLNVTVLYTLISRRHDRTLSVDTDRRNFIYTLF